MAENCLNITSLPLSFQEDLDAVQTEYFHTFESLAESDISSDSSDSENSDSESNDSSQEIFENSSGEVEWSEADKQEMATVADFLRKGCGCKFGPNKSSCSEKLSREEFLESRAECFELSQSEMDMVILSQLQANTRRQPANNRKRSKMSYSYKGKFD